MRVYLWTWLIAIVVPLAILGIWCFLNRWPDLIPSAWTLRGFQSLLAGTYDLWSITGFSLLLSLTVACLSTAIATLAARAFCFYEFVGKGVVHVVTMLPIIVPVTVFAMGVHILFIRMHINNSVWAVLLVQLLCVIPFSVKIMIDVTQAAGNRYEQQAHMLGAGCVRAFISGSLPVIAPGIVSSIAIAFVMSSSQYFLTMLMGGGRIETLATLLMPLIISSERALSSVYSMFFIAINALVFLMLQLLANKLAKQSGQNLGV
jgi:putative spermidine/putrescine transport system permease protein